MDENYKSTGKFTICEDYCVKTQAEVDQILKDCADIYINYLRKKASLAKSQNT